jgi:hypothetical protein
LLSFAAPIWLSGFLLLPVIRWLHRGGRNRRVVVVSRLALWRRSVASTPAAGERRPPDPAWRRRALLTALFFVALSEPQLPEERTRITLWIDDSQSMLTREVHGTRLVEGLAQAGSLLAEVPHADVEVRTLGDPWHSLGALTETTVKTLVAGAGRKAPTTPPAALLHREGLHWLVTDGAHAALFEWPGDRRPDRVIQVAGVTRNVGLERLAARRNVNDPERYDLLLRVRNGGTAVETRTVAFATEAGEIGRSTLRIEAGASVLVNAAMSASSRVRATLEPADALAEDDEIVLDLRPLRRRRVAADSKCPGALLDAIRAHPALAVAKENTPDAEVALDCGTQRAASGVAMLRVLADRLPTRPRGSLQWSRAVPESHRIRLDPERMQVAAQLRVRPGDDVLLAAGDEPLIIRRAGPANVVETSLDFGSEERTRRPEIPLLVNLMFDQLLDADLLDEIAIADRGAGSATVAPLDRGGVIADSGRPTDSSALRDSTRPLLVAALVVLLWEMIALGRQWYRSNDFADAPPQ